MRRRLPWLWLLVLAVGSLASVVAAVLLIANSVPHGGISIPCCA